MMRIAIPTTDPDAVVNYVNAMRALGAEPVVGKEIQAETCDGLLLPGGCDVEPAMYGQEKEPKTVVNPELDRLQMDTLQAFLALGKPVLGICRGHQVLNVYFGGTLVQHLPTADTHMWKAEGGDSAHGCEAEAGTFLRGIYGEQFATNSAHHQGVDRLGDGLVVSARATDGVIEAMEHTALPVWGVQFHPERMCFAHRREDTVDGREVLKFFLEKCREEETGK